jgi:hypothetical protein
MDHEKTRKIVLVKADVEETYGAPARGQKRKLIQDDDTSPALAIEAPANPPSDDPPSSSQVDAAPTAAAATPLQPETPSIPASSTASAPLPAPSTGADGVEPEPDFAQMVQEMIAEVEDDDLETLQSILAAPVAPNSATIESSPDSLKLVNLFHYPSTSEPKPPSLPFFMQYWHKAVRSFEVERDFHEVQQPSS